jgi:putative PIG3 family NAD(P)H quinone oxidoreductase
MMRAIIYNGSGDPSVISVDEIPDPVPGTDDALVEVAYAGLNRADLLQRKGHYPLPKDASQVPGMEYSGIVRSVGSKVTAVAPGDRVCGLVPSGAHAELLTANALTLAKVPDEVTLRDAAAIPEAFITAYDALVTRGNFALGESVVIHAVGSSVGLAAVALVKRGGGIAIGTSRTKDKLERARDHGLDYGFTLDDGWVGRVIAATNARGADVILDFVGAPMVDPNLAALAPGGRIVQIGTLAGFDARISLAVLMQKRAALHGTVLRTRGLDERIALAKHLQRALLPLFANGGLRAEIDSEFPLNEMRAAHERMEANRNFGKIVIGA